MALLAFPPRAPMNRPKSGTADYADSYQKRMLDLRDQLREEGIATREKSLEYSEIPEYIKFLEGKQWSISRPEYKSHVVDNRMQKTRQESIAFLTDIRPTMNISTKAEAYQGQAEIIGNVLLHEFRRMGFDIDVLPKLIDHANFGVSYLKTGAFLPGRLTATVCGADQVYPIQQVDSLQNSFAILYKTYKPLWWFWSVYGRESTIGLEREAKSALEDITGAAYNRPDQIDEYTWNVMSPAMRNISRVPQYRRDITEAAFPVLPYEEYWIADPAVNESSQTIQIKNQYLSTDEHNYWYMVKPGEALWPRKRAIIFAGDRIMYDGPSMYWHGLFPFEDLMLDPIIWAPGGMSRYRALKPIQRSINSCIAGVEDTVKKALNQALITKNGAVTDEAWDRFFPDRPGDKLKMTPVANPATDLRFGPVPELPGYVLQYLQGLYASFDKLAGGLDTASLMKKKQVPSGDSIEMMQRDQTAPFRLEGRMIERFIERLGPHAISNVLQFFTARQRIRILGANGITGQDFDFDPASMFAPWSLPKEMHWRQFDLSIAQGSLLGSAHDRDKTTAIGLFRAGAISRRSLLRKLEISDTEIDKIFMEMREEAKEGLSPQGSKPRQQRSGGQKKGQPV